MSFPTEACPRGRPAPGVRPQMATVLVTLLALVAVLVPLAGVAEAKPGPRDDRPARAEVTTSVIGQPPRGYVVPPGSYFSYPNIGRAQRLAIRNRILYTIQSVWGGRRSSVGTPLPGNGTIRIATWSFDDWSIAKALVAARKRGVSVQVVAAKGANRGHAAWQWLRKRLGTRLYKAGHPGAREVSSFARQCRGAFRGPGGTAHAKYLLFDNVGPAHTRNVVLQTSMNLTSMAYQGQWNHAQVMHSHRVYADFLAIFRQARLVKPVSPPYHVAAFGPVVNYFFPRPRATAGLDPVMHNLNAVTCLGATTGGGSGRTMIRVVQYAMYSERGVWIAKKLRSLWQAGCDVRIVYAVSSRPVLAILRQRSGRGAVPMRQSVVKDPWGNLVKYNHSKWMTITGRWGGSSAAYVTFTGSANWADLAFGDDEQMQRISSRTVALQHLKAFSRTWRQRTSQPPVSGRVSAFGRFAGGSTADVPEDIPEEPVFGEGIYRYLPAD